jgi:hypothetical protein
MRAGQQIVDLLIHWAELSARQGQAGQECAVEWLSQILRHPATALEHRVQAERLTDQLRAAVPQEAFAIAWERGQSRPIEEIVSEILREEISDEEEQPLHSIRSARAGDRRRS